MRSPRLGRFDVQRQPEQLLVLNHDNVRFAALRDLHECRHQPRRQRPPRRQLKRVARASAMPSLQLCIKQVARRGSSIPTG